MIRADWLSQHPYLKATGDLQSLIEGAAAAMSLPAVTSPALDQYRGDFLAGVPLLHSASVAIDTAPAATPIASLVEKSALFSLPDQLAEDSRALVAELRADPDTPHRWLTWLVVRETPAPARPGMLLHLGWTVLARCLRAVVGEFGRWRDEERWLLNYCPTCGAPPAMGQLVGMDPGRMRFLCCGCCLTRWRFRRTSCPFCESDDHRLLTVALDGERHLRIDYCEACSGYLKTYVGEGNEDLFLADWTSIHLDIIARDRGLQRLAASRYDF